MSSFKGFPKEIIQFFSDLTINNNKEWFDAHKREYEHYVKKPAEAFVVALGSRLRTIVPKIRAIPKVNQSLFRLNRDVRFSSDKSPYKTNLGIWFWEGEGKRMECSGFYCHYEVDKLMLGGGFYVFPKHLLEPYRQAVVDKISGVLFEKMVKTLNKANFTLEGSHYKRIPQGYDPNHPNACYLLHNGLYTGVETGIPQEFFTPDLVEYAFERHRQMLPLHKWLNETLVFGK